MKETATCQTNHTKNSLPSVLSNKKNSISKFSFSLPRILTPDDDDEPPHQPPDNIPIFPEKVDNFFVQILNLQDGRKDPSQVGQGYQGSRSYRFPWRCHPSSCRILGRQDPKHHPKRQGTRQRRRHPLPPRI